MCWLDVAGLTPGPRVPRSVWRIWKSRLRPEMMARQTTRTREGSRVWKTDQPGLPVLTVSFLHHGPGPSNQIITSGSRRIIKLKSVRYVTIRLIVTTHCSSYVYHISYLSQVLWLLESDKLCRKHNINNNLGEPQSVLSLGTWFTGV